MITAHCDPARSSQRRTVCRVIALVLPLLLLGFLAASASGLSAATPRDITVCPAGPPQCDFTSIQPALDAAVAGDRVLVAPGVYTGQLTLKSGVAVSSTAGADVTTVRALYGPIVSGTDVVSITVRGLTISGQGLLTGTVGIDLHGSELRLVHSTIKDLKGNAGVQAAPNGETAVALRSDGASRLTLDGVTIQGLRGGDGLPYVTGGTLGGDAIGLLATGNNAQVNVTRTMIGGLQGGAAGVYAYWPYSCMGTGGSAHAIRTSGEVALTVSDSQVSGLTGGSPCHAAAGGCIFGAGAFAGISASGGNLFVRDTRIEASFVPLAHNMPTGYGVLTTGTRETRLEGIAVTGLSVVWAAAQAAEPDSPFCREPPASVVAIASHNDAALVAIGNVISGLYGVGPGGRAVGVEVHGAGSADVLRNQVRGLTGGFGGTTAAGLILAQVTAARVDANTVVDVRGADGAGPVYYLDSGNAGGSAVGISAGGGGHAALYNNVIAGISAGAGSDAGGDSLDTGGRNGGDATAFSVSAAAQIWNNTLYQTKGGRGGTGDPPGKPGSATGLRLAGSGGAAAGDVNAGNNSLVQHGVAISSTLTLAPRLDHNDLWSNTADYAGTPPGASDVHLPPGFLDANRYDFHLRPDSALIDAGSNNGPRLDDMDGEPRPQDGDGDKVAVADIGADEYWPGVHGTMTVYPSVAHPGDLLTYRIHLWLSTSPYFAASVEMADILPPSLTYVPGSLSASSGTAGEAGRTIRWTGPVSTGGPVVLTYQALVNEWPGPRTILNAAELQDGSGNPAGLSAWAWIDPRAVYFPVISSPQ